MLPVDAQDVAPVQKLEKMAEHPDDFTPDQIDDAAADAEQAIKRHSDELHSGHVYVGDSWNVAHRLASVHPKLSIRFAQNALRYLDEHWATDDIKQTERYRIWAALLEAYCTAKQWEAAVRVAEALFRDERLGAVPHDMFSRPDWTDIRLRYAAALTQVGRKLDAAEQKRLANTGPAPLTNERADLLATAMKVQAPGFLLSDTNGHSVGLSDFRGKPVVLIFWATWCTPCHAEMEMLNRELDRLSKRATLLTISVDVNHASLTAFVKERGFRYPVLLSDGRVDQLYEADTVPRLFLIDADGYIRFHTAGTDKEFFKHLDWMLDSL